MLQHFLTEFSCFFFFFINHSPACSRFFLFFNKFPEFQKEKEGGGGGERLILSLFASWMVAYVEELMLGTSYLPFSMISFWVAWLLAPVTIDCNFLLDTVLSIFPFCLWLHLLCASSFPGLEGCGGWGSWPYCVNSSWEIQPLLELPPLCWWSPPLSLQFSP